VRANTLYEIDFGFPDDLWVGKNYFCNETVVSKLQFANITIFKKRDFDFGFGYGCDPANYVTYFSYYYSRVVILKSAIFF
jgi:hypothetical protein